MEIKYRPCYTTRITSNFGNRLNPFTRKSEFHNGVDISPIDKIKYLNEPIIAVADGVVKLAYTSYVLGINVQIDFGDGYLGRYFHLSSRRVNKGDKVFAGQLIGYMGSTGSSNAQHLHFELRKNNIPIEPLQFIKSKPFVIGGEKQLTEKEVRDLVKSILYGNDTEVSDWAKDSMEESIKKGITSGRRPKGYTTREEVITMINRATK